MADLTPVQEDPMSAAVDAAIGTPSSASSASSYDSNALPEMAPLATPVLASAIMQLAEKNATEQKESTQATSEAPSQATDPSTTPAPEPLPAPAVDAPAPHLEVPTAANNNKSNSHTRNPTTTSHISTVSITSFDRRSGSEGPHSPTSATSASDRRGSGSSHSSVTVLQRGLRPSVIAGVGATNYNPSFVPALPDKSPAEARAGLRRSPDSSPRALEVYADGKEQKGRTLSDVVNPSLAPASPSGAAAAGQQVASSALESGDGQSAHAGSGRRVLIVTIGTRGDVQPYLGLAAALRAKGDTVAIATYGVFREFIAKREPEVEVFPLEGDPDQILGTEAFRYALYHGSQTDVFKVMMEESQKTLESNWRKVAAACESFSPTAIVATIVCITECLALAQQRRIPLLIASTVPFHITDEFPPVAMLAEPFRLGFVNRLLYKLAFKMMWSALGDKLNVFRQELALPNQSAYEYACLPFLNLYSSHIVPNPPDWPSTVHTVGYWTHPLDEARDFQCPEDSPLSKFLAAGPAPVYIGFGSMPVRSPSEMRAMAARVLKGLGLRGVLYLGHSAKTEAQEAKEDDTEHILEIEGVPHNWLFPRCAVAVHHGGAGTVAAAARAGIPSVVLSVLGDQGFWGTRLAALQAAPAHQPTLREMKEEDLARLITAALQPEIIAGAKALGEKLRAEGDGCARAVDVIHSYIEHNKLGCGMKFRWQADKESVHCHECRSDFTTFRRRHHCRSCGHLVCSECTQRVELLNWPAKQLVCSVCQKILKGIPVDPRVPDPWSPRASQTTQDA